MSVRFSFALVALSAFSLALAAAAGGHASAADQLAQAKPADAQPADSAAPAAKPAPSPKDYGVTDTARPSDPVLMGGFIFRQRCAVCHSKKEGEKLAYGPHLAGIYGREVGSTGWFRQSNALTEAGFRWDEAKLDSFLQDPKKAIPGVKTHVVVRFKRSRTALIAYLKSLK
jgi:cytochrome c